MTDPTPTLTVKLIGCHKGCALIKGGEHEPEVNPTGSGIWRLECADCATVLRLFDSYDEAIEAGKQHAADPARHAQWWETPND